MKKNYDVVVAGSGPSGAAVASALIRQGLQVVCVSPTVEKPWPNNMSAWASEIIPLGYEKYCDRIWPKTEMIYSESSRKVMNGAYAHFNNDKLQNALLEHVKDTIVGEAVGVSHDDRGSDVILKGGEKVRAAIVIDATGHDHRLILPLKKDADAFQNVYGLLLRVDEQPFDLDHMILMDFRSDFLGANNSPPTFLYAMPLERDLILVEETSLVDNPGVPFDVLKERLDKRVASLGMNIRSVEFHEKGSLPMNMSLPDLNQRVIGFGAAGGFVHPSTGWSVARSLRLSEPVAKTIAQGLGNGLAPADISKNAWKVMWPSDHLRMHAAHMRGMDIFSHMGVKVLSFFMKLFFASPGMLWQTYLSNDATLSRIAGSMFQKKA